jgi:hypothetical protein
MKTYSRVLTITLLFIIACVFLAGGPLKNAAAAGTDEEEIKAIITNVLNSSESGNVNKMMKDFSKDFKGTVASGAAEGKLMGYEEFKKDAMAAGKKRLIVSISNIQFPDIKVNGSTAKAVVTYTISFISYATSEKVTGNASALFSLKKNDAGAWMVNEWIRQPRAHKEAQEKTQGSRP